MLQLRLAPERTQENMVYPFCDRPDQSISEILISKGLLTPDQLKIARIEQEKSGDPIEQIFTRLGFLTPFSITQVLAETTGSERFDLKRTMVDPELFGALPKEVAQKHKIFPLSKVGDKLTVAMVDIYDVQAIDVLRRYGSVAHHALESEEIVPVVAMPHDFEAAIDFYYGHDFSIEALLRDLEDVDQTVLSGNESPIIRFLNTIFFQGVSKKASDIHFEPEESFVRIRYRIDGVLRQICVVHKQYWPSLCVRLKIMSGMNIAENRRPQDGRLSYLFGGREVDFRFSSHPTVFGESLVVRILDKLHALVPLEELGFEEDQIHVLERFLKRPEGMILLTGPTGSGKTTTLYSMLTALNSQKLNIMTLEEPVEYELPFIRQTEVKERGGVSFAGGVRSILRQDPDVILIGEIRDEDTATMALRSAMTGHLVFSTLHTSDVFGVPFRLLDLGLKPGMFAGNVVCVIAQRLVRLLCRHCKEGYFLKNSQALGLGLDPQMKYHVFRSKGCRSCHQTGYEGRQAIAEILPMDEDLDDLISSGASRKVLRGYAESQGFKPLIQRGIQKVLAGETSLEELERTCGVVS